MPFRDILRRKEKGSEEVGHTSAPITDSDEPESTFKFYRTDTHTQEAIKPPNFSSSLDQRPSVDSQRLSTDGHQSRTSRLFGRPRTVSNTSHTSASSQGSDKDRLQTKSSHRRLSDRLSLRKSTELGSDSVPVDLPEIKAPDNEEVDTEGIESQWEARATRLARRNESARSRSTTPLGTMDDLNEFRNMSMGRASPTVPTKYADDNIQEAIRLHEAGDLETATRMFGRLADPKGENNALSQVLYGLALRHGWGCTPNPTEAVTYLSAAASNAASIEDLALQAGLKKGGAAKGELVLAIFELANCFRHGWGVPIDKFAAKQYYETAANLGDTDAMNEVAWCYVEGFGCRKDKYAAARYLRLAEKAGSKTLGNTWIWKEKYDPPDHHGGGGGGGK